MDSRIREIEQWVVEAKSDLGECGREAYLRKLFLLDAEIRALLKDNSGVLPEVVSPRLREKRVRRLPIPQYALAGAAGTLLLAASTVYLSALWLNGNQPINPAHGSTPLLANSSSAESNHSLVLPEGEILVAEGWTPPDARVMETPLLILAAADSASPNLPAASGQPAAGLAQTKGGAKPASAAGPDYNQATSVVLASLPAGSPPRPAVAGSVSSGGFGSDVAVISRESRYISEDEFRNPVDINHTKEKTKQAAQASGDGTLPATITPEQPVDEVDNQQSTAEENVDKLDPAALKAVLEKPFTR